MIKFDPDFKTWVVRKLRDQWIFELIVGLIFAGWIFLFPKWDVPPTDLTPPKAVITFPNGTIELMDVADDPVEHAQGLSGKTVPQSMLFLFEQKFSYSFWMPDMYFPIDIIWLDENRIIGFERNIQPEEPAKTYYRPTTAISGVIEMPSGSVNELELEVGDLLDIEWNGK